MIPTNVDLSEPPRNLKRICPFLGLVDDSQTSLAYPSENNYCHLAIPVSAPNINHQRSRCLTGSFAACPVYTRKRKGPLPAGVRLKVNDKGGKTQKNLLIWVPVAILVVAIVVWVAWLVIIGLSKPARGASSEGENGGVINLATFTPTTQAFTPSRSPTSSPTLRPFGFLPDFPTEQPTASPTNSPIPTMPTRISNPATPATYCQIAPGWLPYYVQPGDTLYQLSLNAGITIAELQRANCMGNATILHAGQTLYLPPWAINPVPPTLLPTLPLLTEIPTDTLINAPTEINVPTETPTLLPSDTPTDAPTEIPTDTINP
jgi:hypothetical protein